MRCTECDSYLVFVDAEKDVAWCKSCGHIEGVDYREVRK